MQWTKKFIGWNVLLIASLYLAACGTSAVTDENLTGDKPKKVQEEPQDIAPTPDKPVIEEPSEPADLCTNTGFDMSRNATMSIAGEQLQNGQQIPARVMHMAAQANGFAAADYLVINMFEMEGMYPNGTIDIGMNARAPISVFILSGCRGTQDDPCPNADAKTFLVQTGSLQINTLDVESKIFDAVLVKAKLGEFKQDANHPQGGSFLPNGATWCLDNLILKGTIQLPDAAPEGGQGGAANIDDQVTDFALTNCQSGEPQNVSDMFADNHDFLWMMGITEWCPQCSAALSTMVDELDTLNNVDGIQTMIVISESNDYMTDTSGQVVTDPSGQPRFRAATLEDCQSIAAGHGDFPLDKLFIDPQNMMMQRIMPETSAQGYMSIPWSAILDKNMIYRWTTAGWNSAASKQHMDSVVQHIKSLTVD